MGTQCVRLTLDERLSLGECRRRPWCTSWGGGLDLQNLVIEQARGDGA